MTTTVKVSDDTLERIRIRQKKGESRNDTISRVLDLQTFHEISEGDIIGFDTYKDDRETKSGHYAREIKKKENRDKLILVTEKDEPRLALEVERAVRDKDDNKLILLEDGEPANFVKNLETSSRFI